MNEPGHPKDNKDDKEITHPEAAITWGGEKETEKRRGRFPDRK